MPKPLKRHPALQPISRQHHKVLQCCFKIRKGLDAGIDPKQIIDYINYFFDDFYNSHQSTQQTINTALTNKHGLNDTYRTSERKIIELKKCLISSHDLLIFENVLYKHVRWEERVLFEWIQNNIDEDVLIKVTTEHPVNENWCELYSDKFWLTESN